MMDELLMTPPVSAAAIRGLLPRRTLEPLMEEEYTDSCTSSSTSTPTEPSPSPDQVSQFLFTFNPLLSLSLIRIKISCIVFLHCGQGNEIGDVADECSSVAITQQQGKGTNSVKSNTQIEVSRSNSAVIIPRIHRSESYRHIIEDENEGINFFARFKPTMKFVNIEKIPKSRGVKLLVHSFI